MPAGLDKLQKGVWNRLKGKTNLKTKKPYTESEAWAIATAQFKKSGRQLSFTSLEDGVDPTEDLVTGAVDELTKDSEAK